MFKHRLTNGKYMSVDEIEILGLCEDKKISVSPRLTGKIQLEVFIHELLHAEHEDWSEAEVDRRAANIAEYLWKAGYRRQSSRKKR
jgi:hypothetical protein